MKNLRKNKSGISLIVLVITIIVMIILATAIILSLSNSGIISKANKAKTDSDTANLKEYVNTLRAEWELMTADEQTAEGSFEAYANKKLEKSGYKGAYVTEDGEIHYGEKSKSLTVEEAIAAGLKIGDTVTGYTIAAKTYETSGNENTAPSGSETDPTKQTVTLSTDTQVTWKYIGIGEDGSLEIVPDVASITSDSPKMNLSGKGGYLNGPSELDKACAALYSTDKGTAKSMNIDHVTRILGYTGEKGGYLSAETFDWVDTTPPLTIGEIVSNKGETEFSEDRAYTPDEKDIKTYLSDYYSISKTSSDIKNTGNKELVYTSTTYWLASPCACAMFHINQVYFRVRYVGFSSLDAYDLFLSDRAKDSYSCALRPVVSLNSNVTLTKNGDGAWVIN